LQPLLKVNEVAVLPRDHSLCRKARLQPRDFTGERFISLAVGDPYRTAIDAMFEDAKVHRVTLLETTSSVAVCAMVRQGLGVAIVNPFTAMELSGPDLVVRSLTVAIGYQVNMLLPEIAAPHPLQSVLADTVRKASADLSHQFHSCVLMRWRKSRPSRSSFHTTSVSPGRSAFRQLTKPGRSSRLPDAWSS
jgi:DNA-binding transcriptional LysR family regulator